MLMPMPLISLFLLVFHADAALMICHAIDAISPFHTPHLRHFTLIYAVYADIAFAPAAAIVSLSPLRFRLR